MESFIPRSDVLKGSAPQVIGFKPTSVKSTSSRRSSRTPPRTSMCGSLSVPRCPSWWPSCPFRIPWYTPSVHTLGGVSSSAGQSHGIPSVAHTTPSVYSQCASSPARICLPLGGLRVPRRVPVAPVWLPVSPLVLILVAVASCPRPLVRLPCALWAVFPPLRCIARKSPVSPTLPLRSIRSARFLLRVRPRCTPRWMTLRPRWVLRACSRASWCYCQVWCDCSVRLWCRRVV